MVLGIYLKKVEIESFVKSFLVFFLSQTLLISALYFMQYKKELQTLDGLLFSEMRICSFDLKCPNFSIDFASLENDKLYKLHKSKNRLSSFFPIPGSTQNALEIYLPQEKYSIEINTLKKDIVFNFIATVLVIFILSLVFSFYTLFPLKNALRLTEEFIKDILHDVNTPLSTLRLNISMLKNEIGENSKIQRVENSVQNILNLQNNLRSYLDNHDLQRESFSLKEFLIQRVEYIDKTYKNITFNVDIKIDKNISTNKNALARIIDNLLSNGAKYNKHNGLVTLTMQKDTLKIIDTGKGIENPSKVFRRFYKEQTRGVGIGLHIVKKLCDELNIGITVKSQINKGSTFFLNLQKL